MGHDHQPNRDEDAEQDIARVLDAERRAGEAITRCERQAASLIDAARDRARGIQTRTDARMSRLRTQIERQTSEHTAQWQERARALQARENDPDPRARHLPDAIARIAAALTGSES